MHHENLVVDERPKRQVSIHLIDQFQKAVGVMTILLMHLAREPITVIHHSILVIASIQHHTAGKDDEAGEQDEEHLKALLATIHKVAVEHVAIGVRW